MAVEAACFNRTGFGKRDLRDITILVNMLYRYKTRKIYRKVNRNHILIEIFEMYIVCYMQLMLLNKTFLHAIVV